MMLPKLSLEVNNQYRALDSPEEAAIWILQTLHLSGKFPIAGGELSVVFVDDAQIAKIHGDYIGDPTPTDVITFPANNEMESAGEIIVSVDHARIRAEELKVPFSRELSLYIIHGWLHLAAYDDKNEVECAKMREAEQAALTVLDETEVPLKFTLLEI